MMTTSASSPRASRVGIASGERPAYGDQVMAGRLFELWPELLVNLEEPRRDHDLDVGGVGGDETDEERKEKG